MRTAHAALAAIALVFLVRTAGADAEQDRWAEWHRARALTFEAEGFASEASEEWYALSRLRPRDARAAVRAAVSFVELIADPARGAKADDPGFRHADDLVREAIRRGALHDAGLAYAIGRLRLATGDREVAEAMLALACRRGFDPVRARLWHARAVVLDSRRLIAERRIDDAVTRLERVLEDFPDHPDALAARIQLGSCYRERGEHVLAERTLNEVIEKAPWAARAHLALANCFVDVEQWDRASAAFEKAKAAALAKDDGVYTGRGVYLEALLAQAYADLVRGELDSCESLARKYLETVPDDPECFFLLGSVRHRRGTPEDLQEAARLLRRANRLAPKRGEIVATLIRVLSELGEAEELAAAQKELEAIDAELEAKKKSPR